jgi:hypothetical protein
MADTQAIHIHLTPQPGTTVHVTIAGDNVTVATDGADLGLSSLDQSVSPEDVLQRALRRLGASGTSPNVRVASDGLRDMGYELILPKTTPGKQPENYLRIVDPNYSGHGVGYLTPSAFHFSRMTDRERLQDLPGATLTTTSVSFSHVHSAKPGLDAALLVKNSDSPQWTVRPVHRLGN